MFESGEYELIDFGDGRKLERFGSELLDRPSPAAEGHSVIDRALWSAATARFDLEQGGKGQWCGELSNASTAGDDGPSWFVSHGAARFVMQLSASGNVGLFPEQAPNWDWIAEQVNHCRQSQPSVRPRVLNLFAYTGGSSLAAAIAGAEVTHVDSSGPTVAWAKRNAEAAGLADLPIRWLVEDAMKFVARECRRGNRYDGIIADPPTYGHGPKGKPFKFKQHLDELMEMCGELLQIDPANERDRFLLFSCHAPGFGPDEAVSTARGVLADAENGRVEGRPLVLETASGRQLEAGVAARWSSCSDPAIGERSRS